MRSAFRAFVALTALTLAGPAFGQETGAGESAPSTGAVKAGGYFKVVPERIGADRTVLSGRRWRIRGVSVPYSEGEHAIVRLYQGAREIYVKRAALLRSSTGQSGYFVVSVTVNTPGRVTVKATKPESDAQRTFVANAKGVEVLPLSARPGARGGAVRVLQRALRARGFVVGAAGIYDARTARAVLAFRKVIGMERTAEASREVFRRLARGDGHFRVRFPGHGKHVEADLSRQVLALIRGRRVQRIYPISSGTAYTPTVLGGYRVYLKTPGTNAKGMVHSSYFHNGYAIHGFDPVPIYPASHGCLRVPVPDALSIFRWLSYGDRVDVYR